MIALVHFIHDTYTGLLAPILPLLIEKLGLSLTQAGSLTVFVQLPSLFNPFLGNFADQKGIRNTLVIISPGLTATFMSLTGLARGYGCLIILLLVSGISVAGMHTTYLLCALVAFFGLPFIPLLPKPGRHRMRHISRNTPS
jgi:FSR family fosmidomycin resistance protein-like MFS transporter